MTVGKSGEYTITCGGMRSVFLTLRWQEQYDTLTNCSVLAVTGLSMNTGVWSGRYYINGILSVDRSVFARLTDNGHQVYIVTTGTPADETNGNYPYTTPPIVHDDDGSKTVTLSVQLSGSSAVSGQHWYANADIPIALTHIPRVSTVDIPAGTIGQRLPIALQSASPDFTHTLCYTLGAESGVIAEGATGALLHWTPPLSLCAALPDAQSGDCTITCETYLGDALVGTRDTVVTLRVPADVGPRLLPGSFTLAPDNSGTDAEGMHLYIQGITRGAVTVDETRIDRSRAYGAEIAAYFVELGGVRSEQMNTGVLSVAGTHTMQCGIVDTRGREQSLPLTFTVQPYAAPVIGDVSVHRCDDSGEASDEGSGVLVSATVRCSVSEGGNAAWLQARYRGMGGAWSEAEALENGVAAVLWSGLLRPEESYEVEISAVDRLGSGTALTVIVPTAQVLFHGREGGGGAAFGKYAESDGVLDVAWDLSVGGQLRIGGRPLGEWLYPVGAVFMSAAEECEPAALYGGEWQLLSESDGVRSWVRVRGEA